MMTSEVASPRSIWATAADFLDSLRIKARLSRETTTGVDTCK
jgi:hypothetical protein